MKYLITSLAALGTVASLVVAPQAHAASSMFTVTSYSQMSSAGWPEWIGRLEDIAYLRYKRPQMSVQYLPLSLIRTGGFEKLVNEVLATPNVDRTDWPSWINEQ